MMKKMCIAAVLCSIVSTAHAAAEHGIKIGYAPNSPALIEGKHLNLYNPRDPSSWRVEQTNAEEAEINDLYSIGYRYKNSFGGAAALDVAVSYTQINLSPQTINLVSQEGAFNVNSDQPVADANFFEIYLGGLYSFGSTGNATPYIGAGVTLVSGTANKTFYDTIDLLSGINTYGQSGSSHLDGSAIGVKVGMQWDNIAVELEHSQYDIHVDEFRSFEIDGADLSFDKTMLSMIFSF